MYNYPLKKNEKWFDYEFKHNQYHKFHYTLSWNEGMKWQKRQERRRVLNITNKQLLLMIWHINSFSFLKYSLSHIDERITKSLYRTQTRKFTFPEIIVQLNFNVKIANKYIKNLKIDKHTRHIKNCTTNGTNIKLHQFMFLWGTMFAHFFATHDNFK